MLQALATRMRGEIETSGISAIQNGNRCHFVNVKRSSLFSLSPRLLGVSFWMDARVIAGDEHNNLFSEEKMNVIGPVENENEYIRMHQLSCA